MKNLAEEWTRRLLVDAGVREGMRVLDIGCGVGNVTFLAAEFVGERGRVVGIDREAAPLEVGRQRARELDLTHVHFACADLASPPGDHGPFGAVIGRRVLMYQPTRWPASRGSPTRCGPGASSCCRSMTRRRCPSVCPNCRCTAG